MPHFDSIASSDSSNIALSAWIADFDLARESNGRCILRFDDTNPAACTGASYKGVDSYAGTVGLSTA